MAANEYYNSFNGRTPQLMNARPAVAPYAPSSVAGTAPPPYEEFNASSAQIHGYPSQHQQQQPQPQQRPYNIADFKYNYDPNIDYGPSTPPPQHAQPFYPQRQEPERPLRRQSASPLPPHQPPRPHLPPLHTRPHSPPPAAYYNKQRPYNQNSYSSSSVNLRPPRQQRANSEPPSPYRDNHERRSSHSHHRRKHHHSHHHSRPSRSRSRSRDRNGRDREKPRGSEKNTFLGALGGSVVGDLIFPGLGTLGGAVLGGWGGHEATKKKEERERANSGGGGRRWGHKSYEQEWEEGKRRRGER